MVYVLHLFCLKRQSKPHRHFKIFLAQRCISKMPKSFFCDLIFSTIIMLGRCSSEFYFIQITVLPPI
jgi:hypothetical protein